MFQAFFSKLIRRGALTLHMGDRTWRFGEAEPEPELDVIVRIRDGWTAGKLALNPYLEFGEAWMDQRLVVENGDAWSLLRLLGVNLRNDPNPRRVNGMVRALLRLLPNTLAASRRNVAHHYDLSDRLYRLFLDKDMQYSCAYFERPDIGLDAAQAAKKAHIAAKLNLDRPGLKVLDIGCGWGGMALHLAGVHNAEVTGVTLSREQYDVARARGFAAHLDSQVRFDLLDYRKVEGRFDRIVSVGMFEHVGPASFNTYFETVAERLSDDGCALIHTIGRRGEFGGRNQWINKYIFPGGYIPSLSEITRAAAHAGLWITDVESLRLHYAETLRCWRERFAAHRDEVRAIYDERFCRMWEFYLASCEMSFRYGDLMVYQVQLAKRVDALPITRDYMMQPAAEPSAVDLMPSAASAAVERLKARAGEVKKGVPGFIQPIRQGEPRPEKRHRAARSEAG